jgi:hypothetical protein
MNGSARAITPGEASPERGGFDAAGTARLHLRLPLCALNKRAVSSPSSDNVQAAPALPHVTFPGTRK